MHFFQSRSFLTLRADKRWKRHETPKKEYKNKDEDILEELL
jgi:hypothetical protein